MIVVAKDKYILFDLQAKVISKQFSKSKKGSTGGVPTYIDISHDDKYAIEIGTQFPTSILMRNLVNNTLVAKFEGHSSNLTSLKFVDHQKENMHFISCAGNECLFWQTPSEVLGNKNQTSIHEVLQPSKILDIESSAQIHQISAI